MNGDTEAVLAANRAFYEAFEARDLDAMSVVWEHTDRATCTHPGWTTLRGWGQVAASWYALFQAAQRLQFILTDERVDVAGDVAWVSLNENILGVEAGATVAAVNVFVRDDDGGPHRGEWRMVVHHASVVTDSSPTIQ